jgi:hypothetical protein
MRQMINSRIEDFYWMPVNWACALAHQMREKGKIIGDPQQVMVLNSILEFQRKLQAILKTFFKSEFIIPAFLGTLQL